MEKFNTNFLKSMDNTELSKLVDAGVLGSPISYVIPLDTAMNLKQISVAGNYFGIQEATDANVKISVSFNRSGDSKIEFTKGLAFVIPFNRFFITSDAQAGKTVTILIYNYAPELFQVIDNRSEASSLVALEAVLAELQGETLSEEGGTRVQLSAETEAIALNADRKNYTLFNPVGNGIIYVRHGDTVVTTSNYKYAIQAGQMVMIDDYRGAVRALASVSGQYIHIGED